MSARYPAVKNGARSMPASGSALHTWRVGNGWVYTCVALVLSRLLCAVPSAYAAEPGDENPGASPAEASGTDTPNKEAPEQDAPAIVLAKSLAAKVSEAAKEAVEALKALKEAQDRATRDQQLAKVQRARDRAQASAERLHLAYRRRIEFLSSALEIGDLSSVAQQATEARQRATSLRNAAVGKRAESNRLNQAVAAAYDAYFEAAEAEQAKLKLEAEQAREKAGVAANAAQESERLATETEQTAQDLETRLLKQRQNVATSAAKESKEANRLRELDEGAAREAEEASDTYAEAEREYDKLNGDEEARDAICGKEGFKPRTSCFFVGVFTAALSRVVVNGEDGSGASSFWGGSSARQIGAAAVPTAGVRWLPFWTFVSLDLGLYSAYVSPKLESTQAVAPSSTTGKSCSRRGGDFEEDLPCQGNATLTPYAAVYLGVTLGRKNLGYATLMPITAGLGSLGEEKALKTFMGWTVGVIQLNGTLP